MRRYLAAFLSCAVILCAASFAGADTVGAVNGGSVATQSDLMGCLNGSQAPASGQQAAILCDGSGRTIVVPQGGTSSQPYQKTYLAPQTALTLAASTALTPPATAIGADVVVEGNTTYNQKIRCNYDGTAPTTTTGHEWAPGASFTITASNANLANVKCIQESASAAIDVEYFK